MSVERGKFETNTHFPTSHWRSDPLHASMCSRVYSHLFSTSLLLVLGSRLRRDTHRNSFGVADVDFPSHFCVRFAKWLKMVSTNLHGVHFDRARDPALAQRSFPASFCNWTIERRQSMLSGFPFVAIVACTLIFPFIELNYTVCLFARAENRHYLRDYSKWIRCL